MQLTILMPCLNEAETIGQCIKKAFSWIERSGLKAEVLIADNGSTDGSKDIARSLGARVVSVKERGYGAALMYGSAAALGQWIIMGDADDSYDFSDLDAYIEKLRSGYDLVMGNRMRGGIAPGAMPWKNRYIGNPVLSWIGKTLFRAPVGDFHCGMRAYTKKAFQLMDLRTTGMEFASEMVIKATLFKLRIAEVPTKLAKDGRSRPPHLRPWRDGWRHLRFMLLFSPRWLFIIPGLVFFLPSLIIYVLLMHGSVQIGSVGLDIHSLFFAGAGIVTGFFAISFGILIRMFAIREGLLPDRWIFTWLRTSPVLEVGGIAGILLSLVGILPGIMALLKWGSVGFGALQWGGLLRQVSLSTVLIMLGGCVFMTSLFIGFLTLPIKRVDSTG